MAEKSLRFARNMGFNVLGQAAVAAINFFAVPILIRHMGVETYGLYIIMHAAASYLLLSGFGASAAMVKHTAAAYGARDRRTLDDSMRYGAWIGGLGALAGGAVLWVMARTVAVRVFHVPEHLVFSAVFVLRIAAVTGVFVGLTAAATAAMQGLQRFDLQSVTTLLQSGAMPVGAVVLVGAGFGLPAVAGWYGLLNAVVFLAAAFIIWRLLQPTRLFHWGRRLRRRDFLLWALTSWSGGLAWMVAYQFDKLFIARELSLAALTLYAVPAGLLQRLQIVSSTVGTVAVPMMSELQGPDAMDNVRRMYFKSSRLILWVCLPILVALFALMPQFLSLWLGGQFSEAGCWPARLLVLSQVCFMLNTGPNAVTFSRDHPWYAPAWAWSQALLSLLAWRLLIPRYGLMGVAAGSLIAMLLPTAVNLWLVNRRVVGVRMRHYAAEVLSAPFLSAGLMLALMFPAHAWAQSWPRLVGLAAAGAAVFYGTTWLLLNEEDRTIVKRFLRWDARA